MVDIALCPTSDAPHLMRFIDKHWRKDHVLARNLSVLDWYYGNKDYYNFLVAREGSEYLAILGFLDSTRFGSKQGGVDEIWLALWKSRDDVHVPALGLRLLMALKQHYPDRPIRVLGLSEVAEKIYRKMNYTVSALQQFFLHNPEISEKKLLAGTPPDASDTVYAGEVSLVHDGAALIRDAPMVHDTRGRPPDYFKDRYLKSPFRHYSMFRIENQGDIGYAIGRIDTALGATALRVVDFWGDPELFAAAAGWFQAYIIAAGHEYADFYVFGASTECFQKSALINLSDCDPSVIVPNYFSPFLRQNVTLKCAQESGAIGPVYKADGDQERPSL